MYVNGSICQRISCQCLFAVAHPTKNTSHAAPPPNVNESSANANLLLHTQTKNTGKPHLDAATSQAAQPQWVNESSAGAFSLLAANFPKLVQASSVRTFIKLCTIVKKNAATS